MPTISHIQLPSGNIYEIKDEYARQLLAGGLQFTVCYDGTSTPVIANIPSGISVEYNNTTYTGTKEASTAEPLHFYLVKDVNNVYSEYVAIRSGEGTELDPYTYSWEKLGDTSLDLSDLGTLAYRSNVVLNKGTGDNVLGESTTFTNASSSVSFAAHTTDKVLGSDATFTTSVTPTTTNIKATASGTAVSTTDSDSFVKSYPGTTSKLATTSITGTNGTDSATLVSNKVSKKLATTSVPNVTAAGSASTWSFTMGTGNNNETLVISGSNSVAPTLGTAITAATGSLVATSETTNVGGEVVSSFSTSDKTLAKVASSSTTVATGSLDNNGSGDSVMTGLGTAVTGKAIGSVSVSAQPTIALSTGATSGTGVISVATGITSATTTTNSKDEVTVITELGAATAGAQTITVGTNDKVKVAKYNDLSVTVS